MICEQLCAEILNLWRYCFSGETEQVEHPGKTPSPVQCLWVDTQTGCDLLSLLSLVCANSLLLSLPTSYSHPVFESLNFILEDFLLSFCPFPFPAWFSQGDLPSVNSCWAQELIVPGRDIPYKLQTGVPQPSNFHSRTLMTLVKC